MCDSSAGRDNKHNRAESCSGGTARQTWGLLTWAVVSALHIEQMASASSSVFFFTCNNCAAWMRGSRVSLAPLFIKFLSRSHSSSWLTLYLYKEVKASRTLMLGYAYMESKCNFSFPVLPLCPSVFFLLVILSSHCFLSIKEGILTFITVRNYGQKFPLTSLSHLFLLLLIVWMW